jgi:hypothetical protein
MRTKGAYYIRTRGRAPYRGRIYVSSHPSRITIFWLAKPEESIYGYMTASVPTRVFLRGSPLTSRAGPYMSSCCPGFLIREILAPVLNPHEPCTYSDKSPDMTPPAAPERYKNHRFPGEIISHGVWLYYRFPLSYRDVQELLFERGIDVTHEAIRQWCRKFGQDYANQLKRRRPCPGDKWHLEQDHRGVKRVTGPMLGFKSFAAAQPTLVGIELMRMLRKGQLTEGREQGLTAGEQFYGLAS